MEIFLATDLCLLKYENLRKIPFSTERTIGFKKKAIKKPHKKGEITVSTVFLICENAVKKPERFPVALSRSMRRAITKKAYIDIFKYFLSNKNFLFI